MANQWVWIGGLTAAVLAVGGIAYAASSSPAPALNPGPTPSPTPTPATPIPGPPTTPQVPAPAGSIATPPSSDPIPATPEMLGAMQQMLAALVTGGFVPGSPPFTAADTDVDPNNPKFVAALAALQQALVPGGNRIVTNGAADWESWAVVFLMYAGLFHHTTGSAIVTDETMIGMAQKALLWQRKVAVGTFPVDGTPNAGFTAAVAIFQRMMAQSPLLAALRTDGRLDWVTFAGILIQAYVVP